MTRRKLTGLQIASSTEPVGAGVQRVQLSGVIDEHADLESLATARAPVLRIDLQRVRRINSCGVRSWIEAIRSIPAETQVVFVRCSTAFIDQCNMVAGFLGDGSIESFYVPMVCEVCDREKHALFTTEDCRERGGRLPDTLCPACAQNMQMDDLEEQYLLFLRQS